MTDHQTAQRLLAMEDVLILTHRRPDGDTIGCAVGLCAALRVRRLRLRPVPGPAPAGQDRLGAAQ